MFIFCVIRADLTTENLKKKFGKGEFGTLIIAYAMSKVSFDLDDVNSGSPMMLDLFWTGKWQALSKEMCR
ncbi:hypothetical protein L2E82_05303 [Cichorium intybus]|uniref:Uncharacterized protein n=1 Tax=Cichorium intybus TaxID=13427 RepID=A0ACB9H7V6_CICIN|nr:hypothetical protein L2E82_05303 [Cichorium intybus]